MTITRHFARGALVLSSALSISVLCVAAVTPIRAQAVARKGGGKLTLERIYASNEFQTRGAPSLRRTADGSRRPNRAPV